MEDHSQENQGNPTVSIKSMEKQNLSQTNQRSSIQVIVNVKPSELTDKMIDELNLDQQFFQNEKDDSPQECSQKRQNNQILLEYPQSPITYLFLASTSFFLKNLDSFNNYSREAVNLCPNSTYMKWFVFRHLNSQQFKKFCHPNEIAMLKARVQNNIKANLFKKSSWIYFYRFLKLKNQVNPLQINFFLKEMKKVLNEKKQTVFDHFIKEKVDYQIGVFLASFVLEYYVRKSNVFVISAHEIDFQQNDNANKIKKIKQYLMYYQEKTAIVCKLFGMIQYELGDISKAEYFLKEFSEKDGNYYNLLGLISLKRTQFLKALNFFKKAYQIDQKNQIFQKNFQSCLNMMEDGFDTRQYVFFNLNQQQSSLSKYCEEMMNEYLKDYDKICQRFQDRSDTLQHMGNIAHQLSDFKLEGQCRDQFCQKQFQCNEQSSDHRTSKIESSHDSENPSNISLRSVLQARGTQQPHEGSSYDTFKHEQSAMAPEQSFRKLSFRNHLLIIRYLTNQPKLNYIVSCIKCKKISKIKFQIKMVRAKQQLQISKLWQRGLKEVFQLFKSLIEAIIELQQHGLFHCDLAIKNILQFEESAKQTYKVIDFDYAFKVVWDESSHELFQQTKKILDFFLERNEKEAKDYLFVERNNYLVYLDNKKQNFPEQLEQLRLKGEKIKQRLAPIWKRKDLTRRDSLIQLLRDFSIYYHHLQFFIIMKNIFANQNAKQLENKEEIMKAICEIKTEITKQEYFQELKAVKESYKSCAKKVKKIMGIVE